MKYVGSKARHKKHILPIILQNREQGQYYVEPFCGGCNLIDAVSNPRIASDINPYLIAMFEALQNGWNPPRKVTIEKYNNVRAYKSRYPAHLVAYIGFCSYGAKWFGGYCRDREGRRDYWDEHYRNVVKQTPKLSGVEFVYSSFDRLTIPPNSIIYCDPPYKGTLSYGGCPKFDYKLFWRWCEEMVCDGHKVFVSEYEAPGYWIPLWEREISNTLVKDTGAKKGVERLFTLF